MRKILLVGNPNVGKSTLFNSLTKSCEHTGNFHGVTVEEKSKVVKFENQEIEFVDLPGLYSLNSFSPEEEVSRNAVLNENNEIFVLCDINCIRKNFYLCQQLNELGINYKILINNHKNFEKNNKIDINKLKNKINNDIYLINAKKYKLNAEILKKSNKNPKYSINYLEKYVKIIKNKYDLDEKTIVFALNGIFLDLNEEQINFIKSFFPQIIVDRYSHIDNLLADCIKLKTDFIYGLSKFDKFLTNPIVALLLFVSSFFIGFYLIFFVAGPFISRVIEVVLNFAIITPFMNFLYMITDNIWLLEFFNGGVINSIITVICFVPQVCLLFVFLSLLEDSGLISRFAYVFDDFLNCFGLNGKALYIMLLGFGCNTMSTTTTRNLNDKNLRTKAVLINPYFSCMARLPVYFLIASAFFGKTSFFVVFSLYVLGIIVALSLSFILNKTILKSKTNELLLEFPPLQKIDFIHIVQVSKKNAIDFFKRIFSVVLCVGIIVWILSHTQFNLTYTQNITNSILYLLAEKISFIFSPIGLNNAGIVSSLIVGVLAKELIVSTIAICNNTGTQKALIDSLMLTTSVINFSIPSAFSFLIFCLLYSPCASNLAVIKKETNKFFMWFSLISQFTIAYMISFVVYQALTKGILYAFIVLGVIVLIMSAILLITKQVKHKKCLTCGKCG